MELLAGGNGKRLDVSFCFLETRAYTLPEKANSLDLHTATDGVCDLSLSFRVQLSRFNRQV
jgi:hypothetical protein